MFVNKTLDKNKKLIETAIKFHQEGLILPDTYVIDLDTLIDNATKILIQASKNNMDMYFMLKQLGRNPYIAKKLMEIGYKGAVVVDYKEARIMMKNNIHIANVGHLVQIPNSMIEELVNYNCDYFTVYSYDKIDLINKFAQKVNKVQEILVRVVDKNDLIYSGQTAGFYLEELEDLIKKVNNLANIKIAGVTSFPCFLYDEKEDRIKETNNLFTVLKAKEILELNGIEVTNINAPSTTCVSTIKEMAKYHVTSGEPGHGLTGTTPLHSKDNCEETPCVVYLSEISHNFDGKSYCFGGGHYRRSHVENALITKELKKTKVIPPTDESIDYHFGLNNQFNVGDSVIMAFRFQIFVTRSEVCVIEGLDKNEPKIQGIYTSQGELNG